MFVVCYSQEECVQRILKKFQGSNKPFPLLSCGLKRTVHRYRKFSTMKVYRQIKILALFLLQKIITMKQYIISLFMGKVCCWYLFLISPGLILVQSSLLFSTLGQFHQYGSPRSCHAVASFLFPVSFIYYFFSVLVFLVRYGNSVSGCWAESDKIQFWTTNRIITFHADLTQQETVRPRLALWYTEQKKKNSFK